MPAYPANCAGPDARTAPAIAGRLRVLLPLPLAGPLDYLYPGDAAIPDPGGFVGGGLGPRPRVGVVWEGESAALPVERLKPVLEVLPTPPLPAGLRRFVDRVAGYTLAPPGLVLRMAMS